MPIPRSGAVKKYILHNTTSCDQRRQPGSQEKTMIQKEVAPGLSGEIAENQAE